MCGIAGILKIYEPGEPVPHHLESIPEKWLDTLDESIKHRGPDGQGRFRDRAVRDDGSTVDVAFVHRRLSIIDHAGGHQPMVHDGQRLRPDLTYQPGEEPILAHEVCPDEPLVAVVFNGCIYNHRELRAELEADGYVFETDHSDTEVLVHSFRRWSEIEQRSGVTRWLNGMYAMLCWERPKARCEMRRDPFGEKPLHASFTVHPTVTAWCSVRVGLERLPMSEARDLDDTTFTPKLTSDLPEWIRQGWQNQHDRSNWCRDTLPTTYLPVSNETPLEANHFGTIAWLGRTGTIPELTAEQTDDLLRRSVRRRLEADVPLGCFLSGGIDSALLAKYAMDELGSLKTFTVRMPDDAYDESDAASQTAKHLATEHSTLDCEPNPADDLVTLIHQIGLPFGDSSLLPTHWVAQAASEHVTVALAGDGGDELFCGYQRHLAAGIRDRLPSASRLIPLRLVPDRDPKSKSSKFRRLLGASRSGTVSFYPELTAIFQRFDLARLLNQLERDWTTCDFLHQGTRVLNDPRGWDTTKYLTGDLLRKTDSASMAVPIEIRCPFLDPELAEAALGTPINVLMPNGERKGFLKQVARKYLPDHIVDRPKQGFAIPVGEWFRSDFGGMRQLMLDHLRSSDPFPGLGDAGVDINMKFVEQMIREHDAAGEKSINPWHGRDHSQRLYMLTVLSIWAKWLERTRREAGV